MGIALWTGVILFPDQPRRLNEADVTNPDSPSDHPLPPGLWQASLGHKLDRELECLALNVYFEAKSEPHLGKLAVAAVTLNRVSHPDFPDTVCAVVRQGVHLGRNRCQFSWACDRRSDRPREMESWRTAIEVAQWAMYGNAPDPTGGALWFHATYVKPHWSRSFTRVARIGRHIYYRERESAENDSRTSRS
jgi:spore germination cell wall hydrolase CwlJ-like protein